MTDDLTPNRATELRASVDDAAKSVSAIYITFVLAGIYIAVAVGSTTDLQLLVESDISLPLLNVGLPVRGFYILVPFGFMLFHLYILVNIYLLSMKLAEFERYVQTLPTARERTYQRGLLFPFAISSVSIGSSGSPPIVKGLLWLIVSTTVLVAPPALLGFALLRFIPYHSISITWWHRALLLGDVALVGVLWTLALRCRPLKPGGPWQKFTTALRHSGAAAVLFFFVSGAALIVVTIPDEGLDKATGFLGHARERLHRNLIVRDMTVVSESPPPQLVAAYIQQGRTKDDAWRENAKGMDLHERDLRGADFSRSSFYDANLKGANLDLSLLEYANFQGADLGPSIRDDRPEVPTSLQGAVLSGIDLRHASMAKADLRGADLSHARLDGVYLAGARMAGVRQTKLSEEATDIFALHLQGADLFDAELQGADLRWADLRGADLTIAHLQAAILHGANLRGAAFTRTDLRGADLHSAILELCEFQEVTVGRLPSEEEEEIQTSNEHLPMRTFGKSKPGPDHAPGFAAGLDLHDSAFYDVDFAKFANQSPSLKEDVYITRVVEFLSTLACHDVAVANGMVMRAVDHLVMETGDQKLALEQHHLSRKLAAELLRSEADLKCTGVKFLSPSYHDGVERLSHGLRADLKDDKTRP